MRVVEFGYRGDLLKGALSDAIDHLRWISALLVCAAHARNLLFPDASAVPHMSIFVKFFYFLTLLGTEAVTVFFVISGLLVGGKVVQGTRSGKFSMEHYAIDRLTRLYIVLIPAVILSILLSPLSAIKGCPSTSAQIMGNLFFLQNVLVPALCNNHPLWSLSNEAFYYLIAGLTALFVIGRHRLAAGAVGLPVFVLLLFTATADRQDILISAPIWCLGIVPWFLRIKLPFWLFGLVLLVALTAARIDAFPNPYVEDMSIAAALTLTLCSDWNLAIPSGAWAAGFSYSLYLIHMPLAQAAAHFIPVRDPSTVDSYIVYAIVIAGIFAIAWLFGYLFEARTAALRKSVASRLARADPSHA